MQKYCNPEENVAVRETCEIAIDINKNHQASEAEKARLDADSEGSLMFGSVDPAPPAKVLLPTAQLREQLLDTSLPLFDRYKAMFALRNQGTKEAVLALCDGLDDESALFRHEIGYVLGQLKEPVSVPALARAPSLNLKNLQWSVMSVWLSAPLPLKNVFRFFNNTLMILLMLFVRAVLSPLTCTNTRTVINSCSSKRKLLKPLKIEKQLI